MSTSQRIKHLRKSAGLTQNQFAEAVGVHFQTVSKWERGVAEPDISVLGTIATVLGVSVEVVLGVDEQEGQLYTGSFDGCKMGKLIAGLRKRAGHSQQAVAERLCVSSDVVSKWERGVTSPDWQLLTQLAALLDVSPSKLYFAIDEQVDEVVPVLQQKRKHRAWKTTVVAILATVLAISLALFLMLSIVNRPTYTIDYWLNGGSFTTQVQYTFDKKGDKLQLPVPQKQGQAFLGWYLTPDYSGEPVTSITCTDNSVSLYAKWQDAVYSVRYELDGGQCDSNPHQVTADVEVALSNPIKPGYAFLGWYSQPNGGERYYTVGGANAKNVTLYACWQKIEEVYNLSYVLNGGQAPSNPTKAAKGEVVYLQDATKEGHSFVGWCLQADGNGTMYDSISVDSNLTLYAVFEPITYVVCYEYMGVYQDQANPSFVVYGQTVKLHPVLCTGYDFVGWFDSQEGGNRVEQIDSSNVTKITMLYARFTPKTYTITLDANGGTCNQSVLYTYGQSLALPTPVRNLFVFDGWVDDNGNVVQGINTTNCFVDKLTARWHLAEGTVLSFHLDGGTANSQLPERCFANNQAALPDATKENHLFLGWNDSPQGNGRWYTSTPVTEDATFDLYAIWQEVLVNGSVQDFEYVKGATQVTITKYTGPTGEDVVLAMPSFVEGLPVTTLGDGTAVFVENASFDKLVLPTQLQAMGDSSFAGVTLSQPLILPTTLIKIGEKAFFEATLAVVFDEHSQMQTLHKKAFYGASIQNVLNLPNSIEHLQTQCLPTYASGVDLPANLQSIQAMAFDGGGSRYQYVYLPSGTNLDGIQSNAFFVAQGKLCVFTDSKLTSAQIQDWGMYTNHVAGKSIVLVDGSTKTTLSGPVHTLPEANVDGKDFLGWANEHGEIVGQYYVAHSDGETLTATYRSSLNAGESASNPIVLPIGASVLDLYTDRPTYVKLESSGSIQFKTVHLNDSQKFCTQCNYRYIGNRTGLFYYVVDGVVKSFSQSSVALAEGDVLCIKPNKLIYSGSYTVRYGITVS